MKRVLIISTSLAEQKKIEEVAQIQNPGEIKIETTASFAQDITEWTTQAPDVLILHLPEDSLLQGYFLIKLRKDVPKTQKLILLCSAISTSLMQLSSEYSKVRMLKTPVDSSALFRALMDLLGNYEEHQRQIHPRYMTDQPIEVYSDFFQGRINAQMKNLSMGGAYFECSDMSFQLGAGDFVKISIQIGLASKQYVFDVKVIWCKAQDSGVMGFGVAFVDKTEVYNNLLKFL